MFVLQFVELGVVTSIENNHKPVESARKGMEVCVKIEPIPGEAPKMFGRHFDEKDFLISKVSGNSYAFLFVFNKTIIIMFATDFIMVTVTSWRFAYTHSVLCMAT